MIDQISISISILLTNITVHALMACKDCGQLEFSAIKLGP